MTAPRIDMQRAEITVNPAFGPGGPPPLAGVHTVTYSVDVDRSPYAFATITVANPGPAVLATWNPSLRPRPRIRIDLLQTFTTTQPVARTLADVTEYVNDVTIVADMWLGPATLATATPDTQPSTLSAFDAALPTPAPIASSWGNPAPDGGPGSTFTQIFKDLYIVDVDASDYASGTVTITASSGEFLLDDKVALRPVPRPYGTIGLFDLVRSNVADVGGTVITAAPDAGTVTGDLSTMQPGTSIAAFLEPLLAARGLRIYAESLLEFSIAPIGAVTGFGITSTILLDYREGMVNAGYNLNASGDSDALSWFDGAMIIYKWTDAAGAQREALDLYPTNGVHTRALVQTIDAPFPGAGAAEGLVRRSLKRARTFTVEQVANYFVVPGWDAVLTMPGDPTPATLKVTAAEFRYPAGEMTLTLQTQIGT